MKKSFFDYKEKRKSILAHFSGEKGKIESIAERNEYLRYLLYKNGRSFYIPENYAFSNVLEDLTAYLREKENYKVETETADGLAILRLSPAKSISTMLGISRKRVMILEKSGIYLTVFFITPEWFENPVIDEKIEKGGIFEQFFVDTIENFILEYIEKTSFQNDIRRFAMPNNYYVENFKLKYQEFVLAERVENEVLLAWLSVSSMKNLTLNKDFYKKLSWFFVMTNYDTLLIGFDKNGDVVEAFDLQNRKMSVKKGIKNTVNVDNLEWTTTMSNGSKYKDLTEITAFEPYRKIREIAKLNVQKSGKTYKYYEFAKFLLDLIKDTTSELTIFLLDFITDRDNAEKNYIENNKLAGILTDLLSKPKAEEELVFWFQDWKPNKEQSLFILNMLIETAENEMQLKKILPLHKLIYEFVIKKEKDEVNRILLDIKYAKHLIEAGHYSEAEKILKKDLKKLPDDSIEDLLPADDVNPTGEASGEVLKVMILELLVKSGEKAKSDDFVKQLAQLQPLSEKRILALKEVENAGLREKAEILEKILTGGDLEANDDFNNLHIRQLSEKELQSLKPEALQKKGSFGSFTKWLAAYPKPDVKNIKDFVEEFNPSKNEELASIIADILHFFHIPNLQIFIARGKLSGIVRAYSDDPPFMVIGYELLDKNSGSYMTYNELRFAIASELAFLYFDFAKITSSDVWRGVMEKGTNVVDTLINLIPYAGSFSALIKKATKLRKVSELIEKNSQIIKVVEKVDKINDVMNKSEIALKQTTSFLTALKPKESTAEEVKLDELLAVSRIMQITADRTGLMLSGNIVSAIRAIILSSPELSSNLPTIRKYGLNDFLLKKNEEGKYVNINYAVRFASLFSFWLSDEYEKLKNKIIENE